MRLNNNSKIVSDDDIIMSDGSLTLSDKLSSITNDVNSLKSNVKWIYKYGGVGSGSGGGGGDNNKPFSVFASLNGIQLKGDNIVLNGIGTYPLLIIINNPNGGKFNVTYSYTTKTASGGETTQTRTQILSIENAFRFQTNINLNTNASLTITVTDGNDTQQVSCKYTVTPYSFDVSLVDDNGKKYLTDSNTYEIFIETARDTGLNLKVDYIVSVPATISYSAKFNGQDLGSGNIEDQNGSLTFPIDKSNFTNDKSGLYSAIFNTQIIPDGQEMISNDQTINISLIPNELYCLMSPDIGVIYNTQQSDGYYIYNPGYIQFNYRIYEGVNNNRSYNVFVKINGVSMFENGLTVTERQQNSFKILATKAGENIIEINVSGYSAKYYFYVKETEDQLDWFENSQQWSQYYYRINTCTDNFKQYKAKTSISQTVNSDPIRITGIEPPQVSGTGNICTHIAIGLQYNYINSDNATIISLYNEGDSPIMTIGQQTTTRGSSFVDCYIQKQSDADKNDLTKYHLLQVFSNFVKKDGNDSYYDTSIYIDGRMEASFSSLFNAPLLVKQLQINPANVYINTIDVDYLPVSDIGENGDYDVYQYYLKYRSEIIREQNEEFQQELVLKQYLKKFNVGMDGRVITDGATISDIAANTSTPVLVMTCQDNGTGTPMIQRLEKNYGEDGTGEGSDLNFPVSIEWSPGRAALTEVKMPDSFTNAQFRASLQGSSTKLYRVKNFTLAIENTDQSETADVYLYSPNFNQDNPETFLPETQFTLKADVVDSSHSNNTTCGKFVNTVCEKFSDSISEDSIFKPYIKNCLEGFPILLFMHIVTEDPDSGNKDDVYYYFGVYNFNLGREAYFNLGYKDLSVFGDKTTLTGSGKDFVFYKINNDDNTLKEGLGVAEIQGGSNYFDFSQYDPTILFQQNKENDNTYMFGDLVHGSNFSEAELQASIQKLVKSVTLGGGYLFDYLKKGRGSYEDGYSAEELDESGSKTGKSLNMVPDYTKQYQRKSAGSGWQYVLKNTINPGTQNDLRDLCIPDMDNNKPSELNFQSVSEYYTICMVLGLVDSVMKNLNIKTWSGKNSAGTTWVTAFYDMDTCLGINNSGGKISYFAFSDYWDGQLKKTQDGVDYPDNVNIYRDFSPSTLGSNGFDVPSSYLFAVAKYARLIFKDDEQYTVNYPQELYAKWRSNVVNNKTHEGILKNADYFVDNFYANNLGSINNLLVTYNYRSKYLALDASGNQWNQVDYQKFNGTRINYVRDWFNGRLHILDTYFNLNSSIGVPIQYRDSNGQWKDLNLSSDPNVEDIVYDRTYNAANYSVPMNQDVIILRDIFSSGNTSAGIQLGANASFKIKCPKFSPLQITKANSVIANYIIGGDNYQQVDIKTTGVQGVKVGGSQLWSYLENINWIEGNAQTGLYIGSDKLESINGSSNTFGSFSFNMPSVKEINLTSPGYTATLSLNGSDNYPNLSSINLSGSKMGLNANSLNVSTVNVSNIKNSGASVTITNCPSITNFSVDNSQLQTLQWSQISGKYKNLSFNNRTNITNFNLSCIENGGSFTLSGDNSVETVTLQGFKTINISNCPKLRTVTITEYDNHSNVQIYPKSISVINCAHGQLCIKDSTGATIDNTVDLRNSTHLQSVCFQSSPNIKYVMLPSNVTAANYCFYNVTGLQTIDATSLYIGPYTFYNCFNYKGLNKSGGYTGLKVSSSTTSLNNAFERSGVDLKFVANFFKQAIPRDNNITNVSQMFCRTNVSFKQEDYKKCIVEGVFKSPIDTSVLNKVTNANQMYLYTGVNVHFKELYNFGSPSGCSYAQIFNAHTSRMATDCFKYCVSKMTDWGGDDGQGDHEFQIPMDPVTGNDISTSETISAKDIWNPDGTSPRKLRTISDFNISSSYKVDLSELFNSNWTSLTTLYASFLDCNSVNLGGLLYNLPNINKIETCFSQSSRSTDVVDLWEFINWNKFVPRSYGGFLTSQYKHDYGCYNFKARVSLENYRNICNLYIKNGKENLSNLFYNTDITETDGDLTFGSTSAINSNAKYMRHTFDGAKYGGGALRLDDNFFSKLPKVQDVRYCFANTSLAKPIPFDFFRKRYDDINTHVFVKVGDEYKPATLHEYKYGRANDYKIWSFSHVFYNVSPASGAEQFDMSTEIPDNCAKNNDTSDQTVYMEYYTRTQDPETKEYTYTRHPIYHCTEFTDTQGLIGGYQASYNLGDNNMRNNGQVPDGGVNKLIIPPDFFYCAASSHPSDSGDGGVTNYSYAFAKDGTSNTMAGIIPENIFKANRNGVVTGVFNNQVVIPRLAGSTTSGNETINVYVQYPKNYTTYSVLNDAFGAQPVILQDSKTSAHTTYNYSFVLFNDSIPSTTSTLSNAFNNNCIISGLDNYNDYSGEARLNLACSYKDGSLIQGFDMTRFPSITLDQMLYTNLLCVLNGPIFAGTYYISNCKMASNSAKIVSALGQNIYNHTSKFIIWPAANSSIVNKMFADVNQGINILSTNIQNSGESTKYYKETGVNVV